MSDRPRFDPHSEEDFAALPTQPVHEVVRYLHQADADVDVDQLWRDGITTVVNVAGWVNEPVKLPDGCLYIAWRFDDDPERLPDTTALREVCQLLSARIRAHETVAVYCAGGLNRSGLVVAQTLIELGYEPGTAIDLVRAVRGKWALSNPTFEAFLLQQG